MNNEGLTPGVLGRGYFEEEEGLKEAIEIGLELKYGVEGLKLLERIKNISLVEKLEAVKEAVKISKNMEEIEKLL